MPKRPPAIRSMLFIGAFSFFWAAVPMAQATAYTLTPMGPLGIGHLAFYSENPAGYPSHFFLWNWFRSSDEGESWMPMLRSLPGIGGGIAVEDLANSHTIFMSYYPGPLAISRDDGNSWQIISAPFGQNNRGWNLARDAAGALYLQASADGTTFSLYSSSDHGATWQEVQMKKGKGMLQDGADIFPFWSDPVVPGMLYCFRNSSTNSAFLASTDGGINWKPREHGMPHAPDGHLKRPFNPSNWAQSSVSPYSIYAMGNMAQPSVYCSDDRGLHWHVIKTSTGTNGYFVDGTLHVKPGTNDVLWIVAGEAGTGDGRFAESLDKGLTWTVKGYIIPSEGWTQDQLCGWDCLTDLLPEQPQHLLVSKNGHIIIDKFPQGLLLSMDGGNTFEVNNNGAMGWNFDDLLRASDGTIYASSQDPYLWRSKDNGVTWQLCDWAPYVSLRENATGSILGLDWANGIWAYSGAGMVFVSYAVFGINSALEWAAFGSQGRMTIGTCGDGAAFYHSDDTGTTWTTLGTVPNLTGLTTLWADPRDVNTLITAGWNGWYSYAGDPYDCLVGGIYCSSDGGMTWNASLDSNAIGGVTCLYRDKDNPDLVVASATGYAQTGNGGLGGIFVSQDGGATWQWRSDGLPSFTTDGSLPLISAVVSPPCGQTLYCAVQLNGGFYRSDDLGNTWSKIADLPFRLPDDYIQNYLGDITIQRTAVTQILPLNDGTDSFLAATMGQGIFLATPQGAKAPAGPSAKW